MISFLIRAVQRSESNACFELIPLPFLLSWFSLGAPTRAGRSANRQVTQLLYEFSDPELISTSCSHLELILIFPWLFVWFAWSWRGQREGIGRPPTFQCGQPALNFSVFPSYLLVRGRHEIREAPPAFSVASSISFSILLDRGHPEHTAKGKTRNSENLRNCRGQSEFLIVFINWFIELPLCFTPEVV